MMFRWHQEIKRCACSERKADLGFKKDVSEKQFKIILTIFISV